MAGALTTTAVSQAASELAGMRRSLTSWLKYRAINDAVLAGTAKTRKPIEYAQRVVTTRRDRATEQDLADKLSALLAAIMPDATLPNANLSANPNGAVQLAQVALTGQLPVTATSPSAVSGVGVSHPWLWPVLIVGGLLLAVTTAIKSAADVASQSEHDACIEAGACTDYGFWLKAGGIGLLIWIAWRELGIGDVIKRQLHGRRTS